MFLVYRNKHDLAVIPLGRFFLTSNQVFILNLKNIVNNTEGLLVQ